MTNKISIVVPAMNEQDNLVPFYQRCTSLFEGPLRDYDYELIIVNDGSTDNTRHVVDRLANRDHRVRGIHFSRNFGQQSALLAGLADAVGHAVITIDADMEQPPEAIVPMIRKWKQGVSVIHSIRQDHPHTSRFKRWSSRQFYRVFRFLSRIPMEPGMLDFKLLDRRVVNALLTMPETDFFLRGITSWIGFSQAKIPYQSDIRRHGKTKYNLRAMCNFAIRGITSFSVFPLRLATYIGAMMTLFAIGFGTYVGIRYFFWSHPHPGYASTVLLMSFFMGIQFLLIGMLGEYVARIHVEVKRRPRYFIAERSAQVSDSDRDPILRLRRNG